MTEQQEPLIELPERKLGFFNPSSDQKQAQNPEAKGPINNGPQNRAALPEMKAQVIGLALLETGRSFSSEEENLPQGHTASSFHDATVRSHRASGGSFLYARREIINGREASSQRKELEERIRDTREQLTSAGCQLIIDSSSTGGGGVRADGLTYYPAESAHRFIALLPPGVTPGAVMDVMERNRSCLPSCAIL